MNNNKLIVEKTAKYVTNLFEIKNPNWAVYHDLKHTTDTVKGCNEIGKGQSIGHEDLEILTISAWFHDTGYFESPDRHEEASAELAKNFLEMNNYSSSKIKDIIDCIIATKISNKPKNILEAIICDSDLISLGQKNYHKLNDQLKLEIELREGKKIKEISWLKRSLKFLLAHNFYTEYAQINFNSQLKKNISELQDKIKVLLNKS